MEERQEKPVGKMSPSGTSSEQDVPDGETKEQPSSFAADQLADTLVEQLLAEAMEAFLERKQANSQPAGESQN